MVRQMDRWMDDGWIGMDGWKKESERKEGGRKE